MKILAIDPGTTMSAYVLLEDLKIQEFGKIENGKLLELIITNHFKDCDHVAMEMIASYGLAVGKEVFETCVWIGRYVQAWGKDWSYVYRKDVKMELCNTMRAKDPNIRQALIDIYGGSKEKAIGTKKAPGPCYGISNDVWAALGVGYTFQQRVNSRFKLTP